MRRYRGAAQHVVAGEDPVGEALVDPPALHRPAHQNDEAQHRDPAATTAPKHGRGEDLAGKPADHDRDRREQNHVDEGHEEEHRVAPVRREIASHRARDDEVDEGDEAVPQSAEARAREVGTDDVVPVENLVARLAAPARRRRVTVQCPCPDTGSRNGDTIAATLQVFWKRAISRTKRRCWDS